MAVERRNPLPVGRYWIDVVQSKQEAFDAWLTANRGKVGIRVSEGKADSDPPHTWILFDVKTPVTWNTQFGYPTIAEGEQSQEDTASRPPPEPSFDWGIFTGVAAAGLAPLALFLGGLWLLSKTENSRRRR